MRVLTSDELDEVFGGDGVTVTSLRGYTVNATVYSWSQPGGSVGFSSGGGSGETGTAPCNANIYKALANTPNFDHIRCLAAKTHYPGMDLYVDTNFRILNEFTYVNTATNGIKDLTKVYVTDQEAVPSNYQNIMYGLTNHGSPDVMTITANALLAKAAGSLPYTDVNGTTGLSMSAPWTAEEFTLMVTEHEVAHIHGLSDSAADELRAWGYAKYALDQYRALPEAERCK